MNLEKQKLSFDRLHTNYESYDVYKSDGHVPNDHLAIVLDERGMPAEIIEKVVGTKYEGRPEHIKKLKVNDEVRLVREPKNTYNTNNIAIQDLSGHSLGNMNANLCNALSPLLDANEAKIEEARVCFVNVPEAKNRVPKLCIKIRLDVKDSHFTKENSSRVLLFGAEQGLNKAVAQFASIFGGTVTRRISLQKLTVLTLDVPVKTMKQLFEVYNRYFDEYNTTDTSYMGMDFLPEEMSAAREKMNLEKVDGFDYETCKEDESFESFLKRMIESEPDRYGDLKEYFDQLTGDDAPAEYQVKDFLEYDHIISSSTVYWIDEVRVSEDEYDQRCQSLNHWYEVAQLYNPEDPLPFDLDDEDIISIFGFDQFESMIDLAHGC